MTYPLPIRVGGDTAQDHVDDHNEIHGLLGVTNDLPTSLTTASTGHLANQQRVHLILNTTRSQALDTSIAAGDPAHLTDHNTIHTLLNTDAPGIRGNHGQQSSTGDVPDWPASFSSSHATFASLQTAVNAAGTGRVFNVTADMTFSTSITPHANDEFWFSPGVLITGTGLTVPAFTDGGTNRSGVKYMNGSFTGFRNTISCRSSAGVEVAYCDFTAENMITNDSGSIRPAQTLTGTFIHHCRFFNTANPIYLYQNTAQTLIEDCEFDNILVTGPGSSHKLCVGCSNIIFRHNWCHDITSGGGYGLWLDFWNFNCLVEWNIVENNGAAGMFWEANPGPWGTDAAGTGLGNVCRYNLVRNNSRSGMLIHGCAGMEIYGNIMYRNQQLAQVGNQDGEFQFYVNSHHVGPRNSPTVDQASDLSHNNIHDNYIEVTPTIGGHQPKRGVAFRVDIGTYLTSATPWINNTKLNNWSDNYYVFNRALTSTDIMLWAGTTGSGTNKTWAQWQALPEDATSSVEA